jgi:hypothetical protein
LGGEFAGVVQAVEQEGFLIAEGALLGAFGNGGGNALGQRADAGVGQKDFLARDGKFAVAEFLVAEQVG